MREAGELFRRRQGFQLQAARSRNGSSEGDALMLPGGVANPDPLRLLPKAVRFVRAFFDSGKPVAAICHATWTLIEADVVSGRKLMRLV